MIIDSHCHAGKGDGLSGPWDSSAQLGSYLKRADEQGSTERFYGRHFILITKWQTVRLLG